MGEARRRVARPAGELEARLVEQVRHLAASVEAFDEGQHSEAQRIAGVVRLLCHSGRHPGLLRAMSLESQLRFHDTAVRSEMAVEGTWSALCGLRVSETGAEYQAPLDARPAGSIGKVRFGSWWDRKVLFLARTETPEGLPRSSSRQVLIRWVANQDGGAHVDPEIDQEYEEVRSASTGQLVEPSGHATPLLMPVTMSLRQIGHEVLTTLRDVTGIEPPWPDSVPRNRKFSAVQVNLPAGHYEQIVDSRGTSIRRLAD